MAAADSSVIPLPNDLDHRARVETVLVRLEQYCRSHDWKGFDPYDALNSRVFDRTALVRSRTARIAFTQLLKRSPLNLRPLLGIEPRHDPKATALFLSSYARLARRGDDTARQSAYLLSKRLFALRASDTAHWAWGYSFPWQGRHVLVPRFAPNLVGTVFVANALLDAFELGLGTEHLAAARSAGDYLAEVLYWRDGTRFGFAYPTPSVRVPVHNANLLGAALLCRLCTLTGDTRHVDKALAVARYSAHAQRPNGSWPYGDGSTQQWTDNFHTGYNLCALHSIDTDLATSEFRTTVSRGFEHYVRSFFTDAGAPKYFDTRLYPIDIHSVAQSLITLTSLSFLAPESHMLATRVLDWTLRHLWDEAGFFYYRRLRGLTIRTPYMRWSQAWMLFALTHIVESDRGRLGSAVCTPGVVHP